MSSLFTVLYAISCTDSIAFTQCQSAYNLKLDTECNQKLNRCYDSCVQLDITLAANEKTSAQSQTDAHCLAANSYKQPSLPSTNDTTVSATPSTTFNITDYISKVKNDGNIQDSLKKYSKSDISAGSGLKNVLLLVILYFQ
eukprot:NODE_70_length_24940_cov_0.663138.p19 type:complete len:141 gc:universal NODE_70_length_24940_cov_0.663138:12447-12869(+)